MSWINAKATTEYQEAIEATNSIEPPSIGFSLPLEYKSVATQNAILIKKNNTLLYFLITHAHKLSILEETFDKLKVSMEESIIGLNNKLSRFKIGEEQVRQSKGQIYAYREPQKIFEEEKQRSWSK